ncbi:hypothetical protein F5Y04DRAFT_289710 [Hypomontagnella monticulosa]|nr:hypothetical protein F5Y04DRAFT_289710 [Hypomontagnella monticulosa]
MLRLLDILAEYISWKKPVFYSFGLFEGHGLLPTWTVVSLFIHGILNERMAVEKLKELENDIDTRLAPEEKPEKLAFLLEDDSGKVYMAKSWRVQGRRPIANPSEPAPGAEEMWTYREISL